METAKPFSAVNRNKQGFGLIEMLVVATIMGVIALGLMQMMSNSTKATKGVQDSSDLSSFGIALQQVMGQAAGCNANLVNSALGAVQFDASSSQYTVLQTTFSGKPIIKEIDYPIAVPGTNPVVYNPNPNSPLVALSGQYQNWQNWQVTQMGIRVLGQEGPNVYNISVEVDFKKINNQSFGASTGLRQVTSLLVTTTSTPGSSVVSVAGCENSLSSFGGLFTYYVQCGNQNGPCQNVTAYPGEHWTCGQFGTGFNSGTCGSACRHPNDLNGQCTCPSGYTAHAAYDWIMGCVPGNNGSGPNTGTPMAYNDAGVPWPNDGLWQCGIATVICSIP